MNIFSKKTELTKKEALTISLVQFCARLHFKEEMFFSQISIKRNEHHNNPNLMVYLVNGYIFSSAKNPLDLDTLGVLQHEFVGFIEITRYKNLYLVNKILIDFNEERLYWDKNKSWELWEQKDLFNDFIKKLENVL